MLKLDRDNSRFKRSLKRLSHDARDAVEAALIEFLTEPMPESLDFKRRSGSRYFTIRAGRKPGNIRVALRQDASDPTLFIAVFVGNHDDLESLDRQDR